MIIRVILAYVLIVFGSGMALTAGLHIPMLAWVLGGRGDKPLPTFLVLASAVIGGATGMLFAFGVFRLLLGSGSFGIVPILVTTAVLLNCVNNDFTAHRLRRQGFDETTTEVVRNEFASVVRNSGLMVAGEFLGVVASSLVFLINRLT